MKKKIVIELIKKVADDFYQNKNVEGIKEMPGLIRELSNVAETINQEEQKKYCMAIKNLADAYEQKNYVMVADELTFEIMEILEK